MFFPLHFSHLELSLEYSSKEYNTNFTLNFIIFPSILPQVPLSSRILYPIVIGVLRIIYFFSQFEEIMIHGLKGLQVKW